MQWLHACRFLCGFSHIFAGGYAAGYFSYKWAEVLSADAFSAFEEVGLENSSAVAERGRAFRDTVLALGGGRPPADVFRVHFFPLSNILTLESMFKALDPPRIEKCLNWQSYFFL